MGQDIGFQIEKMEVDKTDRVKWMEEIFSGSNVRLRDIMVVGTHNSFAKESSLPKNDTSLKFSKEKGLSKTCSRLSVGKTFAKGLCRSWSPCQAYSITQQLLDGVRYLDFRVSRRSELRFEVCHTITYGPLVPLLNEVKTFIHDNPKELLYVHFQKIYNCDEEQMKSLASIIILNFKSHIVSPKKFSLDSRLQDIWDVNKNIIIIFGETSTVQAFPEYLWESKMVRNQWFNKSNGVDLRESVAVELQSVESSNKQLWVIQAILTPGMAEVATSFVPLIFKSRNTLQRLAQDLSVKLPIWFEEFARERRWHDRRPNVILTDFYEWSTLFPLLTMQNMVISRCSMMDHQNVSSTVDPQNGALDS